MPWRFLFLFSLISISSFGQDYTAKELVNKMLIGIDNVHTAKYALAKQERIENHMSTSEIIVKLNVKPLKIYVYSVKPNPGAEALFVQGTNNNQVAVSANKFPYVTIWMSPYNRLLRDNQHHTMLDIGFGYLSGIIRSNIIQKGDVFFNSLDTEGEVEYKGKKFYKLIIDNKTFGYINYDVKKGESVVSIAEKLKICDYMISMANPGIRLHEDLKPGQKIKVPNSYARKIVLLLDKPSFLPIVQFIYDDKGLFENYELSSFILNPTLRPEEFTTKFKDYHF